MICSRQVKYVCIYIAAFVYPASYFCIRKKKKNEYSGIFGPIVAFVKRQYRQLVRNLFLNYSGGCERCYKSARIVVFYKRQYRLIL